MPRPLSFPISKVIWNEGEYIWAENLSRETTQLF